MSYQNFKNKWLGKGIDYDGAYGNQCFDVVNQYILEITGQKPYIRLATADQIFKRPNDIIPAGVSYTKIGNNETLNNFPLEGDIIVWDKAKWNGFGGHTGIVDNANANRGLIFQQDGSQSWLPCQLIEWNFWNYTPLGWLRLNTSQPQPPQDPLKYIYIYPDAGSGLWSLCKKAGYPVIGTDQPNQETTNSICYNRIEELNGTRSVILGKAYKVDLDPLKWFNSTKPVQTQPEVKTEQPTMPTISTETSNPELLKKEEEIIKLLNQNQNIQDELQELRNQIIIRKKADQLEKDLEPEKETFDLNKLFTGAISFKNPIFNISFLGILVPYLLNFYQNNQIEITRGISLVGAGVGILYPLLRKMVENYKK